MQRFFSFCSHVIMLEAYVFTAESLLWIEKLTCNLSYQHFLTYVLTRWLSSVWLNVNVLWQDVLCREYVLVVREPDRELSIIETFSSFVLPFNVNTFFLIFWVKNSLFFLVESPFNSLRHPFSFFEKLMRCCFLVTIQFFLVMVWSVNDW